MAIAFDAVNKASSGASVSSLTYSLTTTGSNITVVVFTRTHVAGNTSTISSITYNGQNLTKIETNYTNSVNRVEMWLLALGAGVGAQNVVITNSGTVDGIDSAAQSLTGTNATQNGAHANNNASTSPVTVTVATNTANSWIAAGDWVNGDTLTASGSTVEKWAIAGGLGTGGYLPTTTTGNYTPQWTGSGTDNWSIVAVEVVPAGAAATANPAFLLKLI